MHDRSDHIDAGRSGAADSGVFGLGSGVEVALLGVLALAFRLIDLGHPPFIDEMHHLLAAESLLRGDGTHIHEGTAYYRGLPFTWLVAGAFALFGQSLEVARLPAVAAGTLLVCLLFLWLRTEVGRLAAWTAALLFAFTPVALAVSQWIRFYTLHALAFWLGVWGLYRILGNRDSGRRWRWVAAGSVAALGLAVSLQVTTVVGLCGVALFALLTGAPGPLAAVARRRGGPRVAAVLALAAVGVVALLWAVGAIDWLMGSATRIDFWALDRASDQGYYHHLFGRLYGFLWVLFPLATLLALAGRWRPALLFACVFGVGIVGHTAAAWKAERYVFYLMPAFFALWGLATAEVLPRLWRRVSDTAAEASRAFTPPAASGKVVGGLVGIAVTIAVVFAVSGIEAYTITRQIYVDRTDWSPPPGHAGERYRGYADWSAAVPHIASLADSVDVVVGEPDMKVIHYLGRLDFVLYRGYLVTVKHVGDPYELAPEFTTWRKVGRPLVSTPTSVEAIMACYDSGLVVAERNAWGWSGAVPDETAAYIESVTHPVAVPEEVGVVARRWRTPAPESSARCDDIRRSREEAPVRRIGLSR